MGRAVAEFHGSPYRSAMCRLIYRTSIRRTSTASLLLPAPYQDAAAAAVAAGGQPLAVMSQTPPTLAPLQERPLVSVLVH